MVPAGNIKDNSLLYREKTQFITWLKDNGVRWRLVRWRKGLMKLYDQTPNVQCKASVVSLSKKLYHHC